MSDKKDQDKKRKSVAKQVEKQQNTGKLPGRHARKHASMLDDDAELAAILEAEEAKAQGSALSGLSADDVAALAQNAEQVAPNGGYDPAKFNTRGDLPIVPASMAKHSPAITGSFAVVGGEEPDTEAETKYGDKRIAPASSKPMTGSFAVVTDSEHTATESKYGDQPIAPTSVAEHDAHAADVKAAMDQLNPSTSDLIAAADKQTDTDEANVSRNPLANEEAKANDPVAGSYREHAEETVQRRVRSAKRRNRTSYVIAGVLLVLCIALSVFSFQRWFQYDDKTDFLGEWKVASANETVVITSTRINLPQSVSYAYSLDTFAKTIVYAFHDTSGSGCYYFTDNRQTLVICEGYTPNIFVQMGWMPNDAIGNNALMNQTTVLEKISDKTDATPGYIDKDGNIVPKLSDVNADDGTDLFGNETGTATNGSSSSSSNKDTKQANG